MIADLYEFTTSNRGPSRRAAFDTLFDMDMSLESSRSCCALHISCVVNLFILLSCCSFTLWSVCTTQNESTSPYICGSNVWLAHRKKPNILFLFSLSDKIRWFLCNCDPKCCRLCTVFQVGKRKENLLDTLCILMSQIAWACCWASLKMKMHGNWTTNRLVLFHSHCSKPACFCAASVL